MPPTRFISQASRIQPPLPHGVTGELAASDYDATLAWIDNGV
jgi:hypothetical protein